MGSGTESDARNAAALASHVGGLGGGVVVLAPDAMEPAAFDIIKDWHVHRADASDPQQVQRWLNAASTKVGPIRAVVHMTGDVPGEITLTKTGRREWDSMVSRFINTPAVVVQESLKHFVPGGGSDPRKFAGASGRVMVVGPGLPQGRKISGAQRARAEVFRGALRPFATTINQELSDVLKSDVRVFAVLPGSVTGREPNPAGVSAVLDYLVSPEAARSGEVDILPGRVQIALCGEASCATRVRAVAHSQGKYAVWPAVSSLSVGPNGITHQPDLQPAVISTAAVILRYFSPMTADMRAPGQPSQKPPGRKQQRQDGIGMA